LPFLLLLLHLAYHQPNNNNNNYYYYNYNNNLAMAQFVEIAKSLEATRDMLTNRLKEKNPEDDPLTLLRRLRVLQRRVQELGPLLKTVEVARAELVEAAVQLKSKGRESRLAVPQSARLLQDADRKVDELGLLSCRKMFLLALNQRRLVQSD